MFSFEVNPFLNSKTLISFNVLDVWHPLLYLVISDSEHVDNTVTLGFVSIQERINVADGDKDCLAFYIKYDENFGTIVHTVID